MTHEACREMLLDLAYGDLAPGEAAEVQAHLATCDDCRAEQERLEGTRALMRRLEPEAPPDHGERLILAAAREAAGRRRPPGRLFQGWVWQLSLAAAALAVVGTVSFRILSLREGGRRSDIEGRPETFAAKAESPAPPPRPAPAGEAPSPSPSPPAGEREVASPPPRDVGRGLVPRRSEAGEADVGRELVSRRREVSETAKAAAPPSPRMAAKTAPAGPGATASSDAFHDQGEAALGRRAAPSAGALGFASAAPSAAAAAEPDLTRGRQAEKRAKASFAQPPAEAEGAPASPPPPSAEVPAPPEAPAPAPPAATESPPAPEEGVATPEPEAPPTPLLAARTWKKDPRIRAIQKLVREIDEARRRGRLVESARPFQACGRREDAERRLYARPEGRTVKYVRQVGGEEVALTLEQLYDGAGRLRYVFIHGGAANGAVFQHRIWLDEEGRRLWEEQSWRRGRYPLPATWPQEDLAPSAPDASALQCGAR